ncbi:MAG: hypothetical protein ACX932_03530 [Gammaproteobacteria bacterium]
MPHFLQSFFEDKHLGDTEFQKKFYYEPVQTINLTDGENNSFIGINVTVQWQKDEEKQYLKATIDEYDKEKHGSPEKYEDLKKNIFEHLEQYGNHYGIPFKKIATPSKNAFCFMLSSPGDKKEKLNETRTILKKVIKGEHPYLQLTTTPSLLEFAQYQTPTIRHILQNPAERKDSIYQTAMDKQRENDEGKQRDKNIHQLLNLLSKFSNTQNMLYELEIINKESQNNIFMEAFKKIITIQKKITGDEKIAPEEKASAYKKHVHTLITWYKDRLDNDQIIKLQYLVKIGQSKWENIINAIEDEEARQIKETMNLSCIANGLIKSLDNNLSFIDTLLTLSDPIKKYLGIENKTEEDWLQTFNIEAFGLPKDYKNIPFITDDNINMDAVNYEKIITACIKQENLIKKINNYFIENLYPGSDYFSQYLDNESKNNILPIYAITTKPTFAIENELLIETVKTPSYIRQLSIKHLAYDMQSLAIGVGSHEFNLTPVPLLSADGEDNKYTYEEDLTFEPTIRLSKNTYEKLKQHFSLQADKAISFEMIGETSTVLMKPEYLRSIFDFYNAVQSNATGILQPDTNKYHAASIKYQHTEDEKKHINRVDVTVSDEAKRLPGRKESFTIEGKRMFSRGKNRLTYGVMAESFKSAGAKKVKIRMELSDIDNSPHLKAEKLRDAALERMTVFAEELIKRGIDFNIGNLSEKFGVITRDHIIERLSDDAKLLLDKNTRINFQSNFKVKGHPRL